MPQPRRQRKKRSKTSQRNCPRFPMGRPWNAERRSEGPHFASQKGGSGCFRVFHANPLNPIRHKDTPVGKLFAFALALYTRQALFCECLLFMRFVNFLIKILGKKNPASSVGQAQWPRLFTQSVLRRWVRQESCPLPGWTLGCRDSVLSPQKEDKGIASVPGWPQQLLSILKVFLLLFH